MTAQSQLSQHDDLAVQPPNIRNVAAPTAQQTEASASLVMVRSRAESQADVDACPSNMF